MKKLLSEFKLIWSALKNDVSFRQFFLRRVSGCLIHCALYIAIIGIVAWLCLWRLSVLLK